MKIAASRTERAALEYAETLNKKSQEILKAVVAGIRERHSLNEQVQLGYDGDVFTAIFPEEPDEGPDEQE